MRSQKKYYAEDGSVNIKSSFLSCEKDARLILEKLFVDSYPHSDILKRLLIISTKDCIDDFTNQAYLDKLEKTSLADLIDNEYVRLAPKIDFGENEEIKSFIVISFDDFSPTSNPEFRDCTVEIDIICHPDYWDIGNFRNRPIKIMGYVDGLLNETKLTGIGTLKFAGANRIVVSNKLTGYALFYRAWHGEDDTIPDEE